MARAFLIAMVLLGIGSLLLLLFLVRLIRRISFKPEEGRPTTQPGSVSYAAILGAVVTLGLSWFIFFCGSQIRGFYSVNADGLLGKIEIKRGVDNVKAIEIEFQNFVSDKISGATCLYLSGNSWKLRGQIYKFNGLLSYIYGDTCYYKISDFYSDHIGHLPPGVSKPILTHHSLDGGAANLKQSADFLKALDGSFECIDFTTDLRNINIGRTFWIFLSDSSQVVVTNESPINLVKK